MKQSEFLKRIEQFQSCPTVYVNGAFGAVASTYNKNRYKNLKNSTRYAKIDACPSNGFFADCCGLIKGVLGGWVGDTTKVYGGAIYNSDHTLGADHSIPDVNEDGLLARCKDVSTDFSHIQKGEMVYIKGHCGVYVGNGVVVEATPAWDCGVQRTGMANVGVTIDGKTRKWDKHGKLPYVEYEETPQTEYGLIEFRADVRRILGVGNDMEAFAKTVTISTIWNKSNALVTPLERYFKSIGYYSGEIEAENGKKPIFGQGMKNATKLYQRYVVKSKERDIDGVITKRAQTWKKLLLG